MNRITKQVSAAIETAILAKQIQIRHLQAEIDALTRTRDLMQRAGAERDLALPIEAAERS